MELLLLFGLGAFAWVMWKRSRGEDPSLGRTAGGCLGLGCLGLVVMTVLAVVVLWLLLQAIADIDLSLSGLGDGDSQNQPREPSGRIT